MAETDKDVAFEFSNVEHGSDPHQLQILAGTEQLNINELYLNLDCVDEATLNEAYERCHQIIKNGSKTFYFGSLLLPYHKRRAMWAVYSFCRYTDDLVDNVASLTSAQITARLDHWEMEARATLDGKVSQTLSHLLAWSHSVSTFKVPSEPPLELIEGCRMDLNKRRYANFEELRLYCYRVASTVGLMTAPIIGYADPIALKYAIDLGIAKQLTNILRDVGEDAHNGRIYIPLDEMQEFGYTEEELLKGVINQQFINLMKFQIERARRYYQQALPGIELLTKDSRLSIAVAANLYSRILDVIERNGYDVFTRRAYVPTHKKVQGLFSTWRQRRSKSEAVKAKKPTGTHQADA